MIQNNAISHEGAINHAPTLGEVVRGFKARVSRVAKLQHHLQTPLWQRNYYEHVVRGGANLNATREYIINNPLQWHLDEENPDA